MIAELDAELAKREYVQVHSSEKKKNKGSKSEGTIPNSEALTATKASHKNKKAAKAFEAVKLAITIEGAKAFELYGNLLSNEARPAWEKIVKAKITTSSWEDIKGVTHDKTPSKMWDSFMECILQTKA